MYTNNGYQIPDIGEDPWHEINTTLEDMTDVLPPAGTKYVNNEHIHNHLDGITSGPQIVINGTQVNVPSIPTNSIVTTDGSGNLTGISGSSVSGISGKSGYSGVAGATGTSGYSGHSGYSGVGSQGTSGYSGVAGGNGTSGYSGKSGYSGTGSAVVGSGYVPVSNGATYVASDITDVAGAITIQSTTTNGGDITVLAGQDGTIMLASTWYAGGNVSLLAGISNLSVVLDSANSGGSQNTMTLSAVGNSNSIKVQASGTDSYVRLASDTVNIRLADSIGIIAANDTYITLDGTSDKVSVLADNFSVESSNIDIKSGTINNMTMSATATTLSNGAVSANLTANSITLLATGNTNEILISTAGGTGSLLLLNAGSGGGNRMSLQAGNYEVYIDSTEIQLSSGSSYYYKMSNSGMEIRSNTISATVNSIYTINTSRFSLPGLPTSSSTLDAGMLWNDTGTIKIK
jgi:hypothetical protein